MKFVEVVVLADATVKETWTLQVPDNARVTEDNALTLIGGRYTYSVVDEVSDEDNRQVQSVRELADEPRPSYRRAVKRRNDDVSTPDLVREFTDIKCADARGEAPSAERRRRLGVVVDELRRRGVLD